MPSVDVITGAVTGGVIKDGENFDWKCANYTGDVYVTAEAMGGGGPWFSPSGTATKFTAPGGSFTVTAEGVSPVGGWGYTANINTNGVKIQVGTSFPKHAKAS
jgi:hypothetical protein